MGKIVLTITVAIAIVITGHCSPLPLKAKRGISPQDQQKLEILNNQTRQMKSGFITIKTLVVSYIHDLKL